MQFVFNFILFISLTMPLFLLGDWLVSKEAATPWIMLLGFVGFTAISSITNHFFPLFK